MKHPIEQDEQQENRFSKQFFMVIIPLAVILTLVIFCVIRIILWNNGSLSPHTPKDPGRELGNESADYFVAMDRELVEGREEDGLQVLFLGDDLFTYGEPETGIPYLTAQATDAQVYNCAFPGSTIASKNLVFDETYSNDVFSFSRLAFCIRSNDYALVDYYKDYADIYNSSFEETIETLKSIDFNTIDIIFLGYGTYDYLNGFMTTDVTNPNAVNAVTGALTAGMNAIHETYPHIRFVVLSPAYCFYDEGDGTLSSCYLRRVGVTNETMGGYVSAINAICIELNVSFLDNFFGAPLNEQTAQEYLDDATHVNARFREFAANKVIDFLEHRLYWQ